MSPVDRWFEIVAKMRDCAHDIRVAKAEIDERTNRIARRAADFQRLDAEARALRADVAIAKAVQS